jgi:hypothetical protein
MSSDLLTGTAACAASPYVDGFGHHGVPTSIEAGEAIKHSLSRLRRMTFDAVRDAGERGLTAEETANHLGIARVSAQPRTSELRSLHLIEDSGQRRRNASGKRAIVWTARTEARHDGA